jgi:putative ABC transport system ATP-binding protein
VDDRGQTILMVTHDARAAAVADRLALLKDGNVVDQQALPRGASAPDVLRALGELQ